MIRLLLIFSYIGFLYAQDAQVDAINQELDALQAELTDTIPTQRVEPPLDKLEFSGEQFYEVKEDVQSLKSQIDSLKYLLKIYNKKEEVPPINEELLKLASSQGIDHRITLENGTVVMGKMVSENDAQIVLQTSIGKLVISRDKVLRIDEYYPDTPQIDFIGEPQIKVYPEMEVIIGKVKNTGTLRADFVRVVANLWSQSTELAFQDSAFVNGQKIKYNSGVFTDTSLEPGATATFKVIVKVKEGSSNSVSYRTFDTKWNVIN